MNLQQRIRRIETSIDVTRLSSQQVRLLDVSKLSREQVRALDVTRLTDEQVFTIGLESLTDTQIHALAQLCPPEIDAVLQALVARNCERQ